MGEHQVLVVHRLQGVGGVRVLGVRDHVHREPDDAAGDAGRRRGGGVPRPVPQRGQQRASDLVQREGVRARIGALLVDGRDGPDDVLGQPQQDERQFRVRLRPPGDSGVATHLQRQEVVEAALRLHGRQRSTGRDQVRHGGLFGMAAVRITTTPDSLERHPCGQRPKISACLWGEADRSQPPRTAGHSYAEQCHRPGAPLRGQITERPSGVSPARPDPRSSSPPRPRRTHRGCG